VPFDPGRLQRAVAAALERLTAQQRRWPRDGGHVGWIHGDLHPWNLLFAEGRAGAIDFSDSGWGWLAQDLAAVLHFLRQPIAGWADHRTAFDRLRDALFTGYRSVRVLPDSLCAQTEALHAQRLLGTLLWMADDWASPADRPWGPVLLQQLPDALTG
jgi:Ser/Thr protein kinase RdoA (MazF antagonist)